MIVITGTDRRAYQYRIAHNRHLQVPSNRYWELFLLGSTTWRVVFRVRSLIGCFSYSSVYVRYVDLTYVDMWSFVYQHEVKSGWFLAPTCFGGSVPVWVTCHPVFWGICQSLKASDSLLPDEVMVSGHLLWPGRSTFIVHVKSDVQLKTVSR